jgi:hypothetical protein
MSSNVCEFCGHPAAEHGRRLGCGHAITITEGARSNPYVCGCLIPTDEQIERVDDAIPNLTAYELRDAARAARNYATQGDKLWLRLAERLESAAQVTLSTGVRLHNA